MKTSFADLDECIHQFLPEFLYGTLMPPLKNYLKSFLVQEEQEEQASKPQSAGSGEPEPKTYEVNESDLDWLNLI